MDNVNMICVIEDVAQETRFVSLRANGKLRVYF